jgi:alanine dehydrogenase
MQNQKDILLLDCHDVRALLTHDESLKCVRHAYEAHSAQSGRAFSLVREFVGANAVFGIKSGDISGEKVLGLKVAGFWPGNNLQGKDAHQATIILIDPETGRPKGFFDGNYVTSMRTGAAGGIGIEMLARKDSTQLCVFGSGVQAQIQLDYALRVMPSLAIVAYVTVNSQPDDSFEKQFSVRCNITHAANADAAVSQADIVITATPSKQALFSVEAVKPGTHINAVGADTKGKRELPAGLLEKALLVVDDMVQARNVGESQWSPGCEMLEIGTLLRSQVPFERPASAISIFDMTGLALQDLTVAQSLYQTATAQARGQRLPWAW